MMLKPALALAALALAPNSTIYSDATPPLRFQQGTAAVLITVHPSMLPAMCGVTVPKGYELQACMIVENDAPVIIMPNPCMVEATDAYAHLLCHETGHVNGWPGSHGD